MRSALVLVLVLTACGGAPPPPPAAIVPAQPEPPPLPPPEPRAMPVAVDPAPDAAVECKDVTIGRTGNDRHQCTVTIVTPDVKRRLESYPDKERVSLHFDGNPKQEDFATVASLPWLTDLAIEYGAAITSLEPLQRLTALEELMIDGAQGVRNFDALGGMKKLRTLRMMECGASSLA